MKKVITIVMLIVTTLFLTGYTSYRDEQPTMLRMHATAYCLQGKTYTGKHVRKGIAATGNKDLLGLTAVVYQRLPDGDIGDLIGIYEIEDTGCKENVIDIWCEDLEECQELMDQVYEDGCQGRVWCEIIDAKG